MVGPPKIQGHKKNARFQFKENRVAVVYEHRRERPVIGPPFVYVYLVLLYRTTADN
jgi:hypothetical protein